MFTQQNTKSRIPRGSRGSTPEEPNTTINPSLPFGDSREGSPTVYGGSISHHRGDPAEVTTREAEEREQSRMMETSYLKKMVRAMNTWTCELAEGPYAGSDDPRRVEEVVAEMERKGRTAVASGAIESLDEVPGKSVKAFVGPAQRWWSRLMSGSPSMKWQEFRWQLLERYGDGLPAATRVGELWMLQKQKGETHMDYADRLQDFNVANATGADEGTLKAIFMAQACRQDHRLQNQTVRHQGNLLPWNDSHITLDALAKACHHRYPPSASSTPTANLEQVIEKALADQQRQYEQGLDRALKEVKKEVATLRGGPPRREVAAMEMYGRYEGDYGAAPPHDEISGYPYAQMEEPEIAYGQQSYRRQSPISGGSFSQSFRPPTVGMPHYYGDGQGRGQVPPYPPFRPGPRQYAARPPPPEGTSQPSAVQHRANAFGVPVCNVCGDPGHRAYHHCDKCQRAHVGECAVPGQVKQDFPDRK
jgi:hypothetical protein